MASSREGGFTLFEILVSLAIASLIMLGLSSAMRQMNMGWDRATGMGERQAMLATGLDVFGGDLARVERVYDNPAKPERFLFVGDKSEIIFPLTERDSHNREGLYWIRYALRKAGPDIEMVRQRGTYEAGTLDLPAVVWKNEVVLVRGAYRITFAYLPPTGTWTGNWPMQNRLPRQVRVDVETVRGRPLTIPSYVATLDHGAEVACANPNSQFCTLKTGGSFTPRNEAVEAQ